MTGAHRRAARRLSAAHALLIAAVVLSLASAGVGVLSPTLAAAEGAPSTAAVTDKVAASRAHLVDGADVEVDSRTIAVTVSQTADLRAGQQVRVSWTGAHPTGGLIPDPADYRAIAQEYPMVLMQCRGIDTVAAPLTPETCWTQSPRERYFADNDFGFPAWRVDRDAEPEMRTAHPGQPEELPTGCLDPTLASVWVPFVAADDVVYPGGPANGCAGAPSESGTGQPTPANTTYAVTNTAGAGSARFEMWDKTINQSLGCSETVVCSLVAIPIMGIGCDIAAAGVPAEDRPAVAEAADPESISVAEIEAACTATGRFAPGAINSQPGIGADFAVSGALWWSASNWKNRLSFPLSFSFSGDVCAVTSGAQPTLLYGSPLMTAASQQWAPAFCTDPARFTFRHVQNPEPQSLNLVSGPARSAEAALVSYPALEGYTRPTVNAPVAISGFAISYMVDGVDGSPYTSLRLNARLIAKLVTGSYAGYRFAKEYNPGLVDNPLNLTTDPEFIALNPGIAQDIPASVAASTIFLLSSRSDVMTALTSYLDADAEARSWMDGSPDPWGMTVNPPYKALDLPVDQWPLLDTFDLTNPATPDVEPRLGACKVTTPWMNLVASPTQSLRSIAEAVKFGMPQSQINCSQEFNTDQELVEERFVSGGRQQQGYRFMLGLTTLADSELYQLETADLQTTASVTDPSARFTDDTGRTFVGPTEEGLRAATAMLTGSTAPAGAGKTAAGSFPLDHAKLASQPGGVDAYPATMVVYAVVPTTGLSAGTGARLAQLLRFAASDGQAPGFGNGELPPGYLPMTAANGAGALVEYTLAAADAVEAQSGQVPPLGPQPEPEPQPQPTTPLATTSGPVPAPPAPPAAPLPAAPRAPSSAAPPAATVPTRIAAAAPPATGPVTLLSAQTPEPAANLAGVALPTLLGLAAASGLLSAALAVRPRVRRRR